MLHIDFTKFESAEYLSPNWIGSLVVFIATSYMEPAHNPARYILTKTVITQYSIGNVLKARLIFQAQCGHVHNYEPFMILMWIPNHA